MKTTYTRPHTVLLVISLLSAALVLTACDKEGSAEKTGAKIDKAVEKADVKIDKAAEKADAKIDEVTAKAGNELEKAKSSVTQTTQAVGEYIDDSMITAKVKEVLMTDDSLKTSHIEVNTVNGVVQLTGKLGSEVQIGRAVDLAGNQKHVKAVKNDLIYSSGAAGE